MKKPIEVVLLDEAYDFLMLLPVFDKQLFTDSFGIAELGLLGDEHFIEVPNTYGMLWGFPVKVATHRWCILAFWDDRSPEVTRIVCTHGLNLNNTKIPIRDVQRAEKIRQEYFAANDS